jgi:2-dehydropantoate 2-reductase
MSKRILIVGGGAIGGIAAAHLTRAGVDVTVLDANHEHVALLRRPGLIFEELDQPATRVPIEAVAEVEELAGHFDFALVTVKSLALEAALGPLMIRRLVDTYVSFGNGLVQHVVESVVGGDHLLIGLVEWGATNLGPGHLRQTTRASMVVGELDGRRTERLDALVSILRRITPEARSAADIQAQIWSKLLLNSTFSGLGAIAGLLYREVATHPVGRELAFALWTEGYEVAVALQLELGAVAGVNPLDIVVRSAADRKLADPALDRLMVRLGDTRASMLQDLERRQRTEVDVINGAVVEAARCIGLRAPLNEEVTRIVHEYERDGSTPSLAAFDRLTEVFHDVTER